MTAPSCVKSEPSRLVTIFLLSLDVVTLPPATGSAVLTDRESTNTAVSVSDLRPARNQGSVGGYRDILKDQLFAQMLGDRLDEMAQGERPPFLRAGAGRGLVARTGRNRKYRDATRSSANWRRTISAPRHARRR